MKHPRPPRAATALLRLLLPEGEREFLLGDLEERWRERRQYFASVAPVLERYEKAKLILAEAGPPGASAEREGELAPRMELSRKRFRNLFAKLDEILPPGDLSTAHDLFQDALLCLSYAAGAWLEGDRGKWADFLEKAESQVRPLLAATRSG